MVLALVFAGVLLMLIGAFYWRRLSTRTEKPTPMNALSVRTAPILPHDAALLMVMVGLGLVIVSIAMYL